MTRIKLTTVCLDWPWARQTPGGRGEWGGAKFVIDRQGEPAEWWFIYDDLPGEETIECGDGKVVLITPEPPALKQHRPEFLAQFDWVLTPDRDLAHPHKIYSHQGLPWHVGRLQSSGKNISFSKDYDELKATWPIPKTKLISVIASDKTNTPGHKARFDFVQSLKAHFGDHLEVFGWGGCEVADKWDGIAPFKYHVAIENSAATDYWTEKIGDSFLAGAFPIYFGCPNIMDYFPAGSLAQIDIHRHERGIAQIEEILAKNLYDAEKIAAARELVLDRYNLFAMLEAFTLKSPAPTPLKTRTLRPASAFFRAPSLLERIRNKVGIP